MSRTPAYLTGVSSRRTHEPVGHAYHAPTSCHDCQTPVADSKGTTRGGVKRCGRCDIAYCNACDGVAPALVYLATHRVTGYRETPAPRGDRNAEGYGNRIPLRSWLELDDKRWHRVYCVCWGTGATAYVKVDGQTQYLATGELDAIVRRCGLESVARPA